MSVELPSFPALEKRTSKEAVDLASSESKLYTTDFGGESSLPPPPQPTPEEEQRLWRKVDIRLLPILAAMYLVSFLDRGNIGNAKLQGLESQLNLTGNQFNIVLFMYFIPYSLLQCLANLVLKRFKPSRWLPGITTVWGLVMLSLGFVKNYPQLLGVRICLAIAEAGFVPGALHHLSIWYPRHMLQYRFALFISATSLAGAFSGLLAYGIHFMSGIGGKLGWSWIFIIEGLVTVVVGLLGFIVLVDFPVTARFLTPEERSFLIWRKKYDNSSVGEEEHFEMRHIWAAISDWQVWLHLLIFFSMTTPLYGITFFLPTIINSFGYSPAISQLLSVPPYVVGTITLCTWAVWSDKLRKRSPFILAGLICCLIGFSINISNAPRGAKYFGTFFIVAGSYSAYPGTAAWLGNNLSGQYKRGVGMGIQIGLGTFGGVFASNIYRGRDSPRFIIGHACELMFVGMGLICVLIAVLVYIRINKRRDELERGALENGGKYEYTPQQIREMGDRAPNFRYTL